MFSRDVTKKLVNYLGQLRIYSLIDYMLMLVAAGASPNGPQFWGALDYWVGFLAHLESVHHDQGREPVPGILPWAVWLLATTTWKNDDVGFLFIALSLIYAWKKRKPWGLVSPFVRGLQALVITGGIMGYGHLFPWVAAVLTGRRNWKGDQRDKEEDQKDVNKNRPDGVQTWPVVMGQEKDKPFAHLTALLVTTWVWWWFSKLPWWVPMGVNLIQLATYWCTPRTSNTHANLTVCGKTLLYHGRWGGR